MRALSWLPATRRRWLLFFQVMVLLMLTAALLKPPPEVAQSDGAALARLVGGVLVLMAIAATAMWSSRRHLWRWFGAAVVLLSAAVALQTVYASQREKRTCVRGEERFVTGTELTPLARKHAADLSITDCAALLDEFVGVRTDVWPATSIGASAAVLLWLHAAYWALFGASAIVAAHVVGTAVLYRAVGNRPRTADDMHVATSDSPPGDGGVPNASLATRARHALTAHFSLDEIRTLCADLSVDYENLPGESKEAKARELVEYVIRRQRIDALVGAIREQRGPVI